MRESVSEFIVVPPANQTVEIQNGSEQLRAYLARFFPRYSFRVGAIAPFQQDDDWTLIPVAGVAGDGPGTGLFKPAPETEIMEIYDALRCYRVDVTMVN